MGIAWESDAQDEFFQLIPNNRAIYGIEYCTVQSSENCLDFHFNISQNLINLKNFTLMRLIFLIIIF